MMEITNKKSVYIIISIIAVIFVIMVSCLHIHNVNKKKRLEDDTEDINLITNMISDDNIEYNENGLKTVKIRNDFYSVQKCVNKFYTYYKLLYQDLSAYYGENLDQASIEEAKQSNIETLYNMLDTDYITENRITKDNITSKLPKIDNVNMTITNMLVDDTTNGMNIYAVKGLLINSTSKKVEQFQVIVKVDEVNKAFSVSLEDIGNVEEGDEIEWESKNRIEENNNNQYNYQNVSDDVYARDLFNQYKTIWLNDAELAYDYLDENYRETRFKSSNDFREYLKNDVNKEENTYVSKYLKTTYEDYVQYVFIDNKGNYYILRETAPMRYSVIFDNHTIDTQEFIEKYNSARNENKVAMNIEKIKDAINTDDFQYVYNKLDNTFKQNYYPTLESLEEFLNDKLYDCNNFEYTNIEENNGIYIFRVTASDTTGKASSEKYMNVVMQLNEGTDFTMSFSID